MEELDEKMYDGDYDVNEDDVNVTEYNISVAPNDFNIKTIFDFIEHGVVKIPAFQRNYVWDIKHASKLIESLLIGVPIPQVFLYEEKKNSFLVIDGQQRLMTIYYFMKKRFPRKDKRVELRQIFDQKHTIPDEILHDNQYFTDFNLVLPENLPDKKNRFNKKNYATLNDEDRISFELKTLRNIIVKQAAAGEDDSVVFEIFNRLNSGGVNLKPQEIRTSLFHSAFYDMLYRINLIEQWRYLLTNETPNINMKDVEIILRGFAMLVLHGEYKPSMNKFLNVFSRRAQGFKEEDILFYEHLFVQFCVMMSAFEDNSIFLTNKNRFNISVYEAVFTALCEEAYSAKDVSLIKETTIEKIKALKEDSEFLNASLQSTASSNNVAIRIKKAKEML